GRSAFRRVQQIAQGSASTSEDTSHTANAPAPIDGQFLIDESGDVSEQPHPFVFFHLDEPWYPVASTSCEFFDHSGLHHEYGLKKEAAYRRNFFWRTTTPSHVVPRDPERLAYRPQVEHARFLLQNF